MVIIVSAFSMKTNVFLIRLKKRKKVEYKVAQFRATHLDLEPGGGCEITIRTLKGVGVQVRPLVVLHVRASVKRLHAYSAGKPLGAQATGRARSRGRGWSFAAQLTGNKPHSQRGGIRSVDRSLHAKTTDFSQLPPPVAEHHQPVLK